MLLNLLAFRGRRFVRPTRAASESPPAFAAHRRGRVRSGRDDVEVRVDRRKERRQSAQDCGVPIDDDSAVAHRCPEIEASRDDSDEGEPGESERCDIGGGR